jgi:aryl-alcohol dehydrogenase-like predicted oxidoreductase
VRYRQFGKTGWKVSEIGFGGARIGGLLARDGGRSASLRTLDAAFDAGINFYDTANIYAQGESEILIGKSFRTKRDKVFIASKGGYTLPAKSRLIQLIKPFVKPIVQRVGLSRAAIPAAFSGGLSQDFSPLHLRSAAEASLRRLRCDYIDLYQLHSPPPEELRGARFADTLGELARLKAEGKIREFGIALDAADHARDCLAFEGVASVQLPFGLLDLEGLDGVLQALSERQFGIIARGCFAGGALKETLSEAELRAMEPKWERVLLLRQLCRRLERTALEAALQFALRVGEVSVTILGMRTPQQLASNLEYYGASALSDEEFQELLAHPRAGRH